MKTYVPLVFALILRTFCLAAPGDLKWTFNAIPTPESGLSSLPAVLADGTVLIVAPGQALYAVSASGRELWRYAPTGGVDGAPVVGAADVIYVGGSHLRALQAHGSVRWSFPSPSGSGFDVPVLGADGTVYSVAGDGRLHALRGDGTLRWVASTPQACLASPVIGPDGALFLNLRYGGFAAMNPDGNLRWTVAVSGDLSGPAAIADHGTLYVASSGTSILEGWLYAFSSTGSNLWTFASQSASVNSPVIGGDGTVYSAFLDGRVVALRPDGTLRWEYRISVPQTDAVVATPAVAADGTVYVAGAQDQNLHAIAPDGQPAWVFAAGTTLTSPPVLGADGTVYFGGSNGRLYAVEGSGSGLPETQWPRYRRDAHNSGGTPQLPNAPPVAPESVTASLAFTEKTVITWSSVPDAAEYSVWRGTNANELTALAGGIGATTHFNDTSAIPGVDYFYAVQAANVVGPGPLSAVVPGHRRIAQPGELVWKLAIGSGVSTPSVGLDGAVCFGGADGKMYAVDPLGVKRWDYDFQGTLGGGPVVAPDGTVFFTAATRLNHNVAPPNGHSLFALSPNGGVRWRYDFSGAAAGGIALAADGTIYAVVQEDESTMALLAFNSDGQLEWRLEKSDQASEPPAIGSDGTVYFGTRWGRLYAVSPAGTQLWMLQNNIWMNTVAIDGKGVLYVSGSELISVNPDGTERWTYPGTDSGVSPVSIASDGTIYVGLNDGTLRALNSDRAQQWELPLGGMPGASMIGADGTLYVPSLIDMFAPQFALHAVSAAGAKLWSFVLNVNISAPVLGHDNTVFFAAADNSIYAVRTAAAAASAPWSGFQHDPQHTGRTDLVPPPPGTPAGLVATDRESPSVIRLSWSSTLGASAYDVLRAASDDAAAAVVVGTVAALSWRDLNATPEVPFFYWVRARNAGGASDLAGPARGVRRQPMPGDVMFEWAVDGIVHASPAIAVDGTLYVGVQNRTDTVSPCALYALNPDGTIKWSYTGTTWVFGSPAIGPDGTIYYGAYHQNLVALNPDGSRKWEFNPGSAVVGTPAVGPDGAVYFGALGGGFYAFNENGTKRWEYAAAGGVISSAALTGDGSIYFVAGDDLHALNADGTLRWRTGVGGSGVDSPVYSSPAVAADGTLYVGSTFSGFHAINTDGTRRWTYGSGQTFLASPVIDPGGNVLIGSSGVSSLTSAVALNWTAPIGGVLATAAMAADGRAYIGTREGTFVAIESDGAVAWQVDLGTPITSSAAIGADGLVYVGADDRKVRALYAEAAPAATPWPMFQHDARHSGRSPYRPELPGAPTPVSASHGDYADRIEVTWPSLPGAYLYEVWRHTNLTVTSAQQIETLGAKTNFTDSTACAGVEYQYWVRALNSQGTGPFSAPAVGLRRLPLPGDVIWRSALVGDGISGPAVSRDGLICFPGRDRRIYAFGSDFNLRWTYPRPGDAVGASGNLSEPAIADDGAVLFGAPDGYFYALNSDGSLRWRWRSFGLTWSMPAVGDDRVHVVDNMNSLYSFVLTNGNQSWKATPYVSSPGSLVDVDGTVLAANANRYLAAYGPGSNQRWLLSTTLSGTPVPLMFGPDATVYLASGTRLVAAAPEGTNRWVSNYTRAFTTGLVMDRNGTLYGGGANRLLLALAADGKKRWEFTAGGDLQSSPVLGENGQIFFLASDRRLYALNPEGTKAWDVLLPNLTVGSIRSALNLTPDGAILVSSAGGPLLAVASGTRLADAPWPVHGGAPWRGGRRQPQLSYDPAQSRLNAGHAEPVLIQPLLRSPGRTLARVELYEDYRATNAFLVATQAPFAFVLTNLAVGTHSYALRAVDSAGLAYRSAPFTATVTSTLRVAMRIDEGAPLLEFPSVPGHVYTILASPDLTGWEAVQEVTATEPFTQWPVVDEPPSSSKRFYRVRFTP